METTARPYPVDFDVDYPEAPRNRVTVAVRLVLAVPILVVIATIGAAGAGNDEPIPLMLAGSGALFLPPLLLIVARQKYPRWWFDFNVALLGLNNRVAAYMLLLRDEYPSTDHEQSVHLQLPYPDAHRDLNRWLPLVKWLLAIPHYVVLVLLHVAVLFTTIAAWVIVLATGRYPQSLFRFTVGVMRWNNRVVSYAFLLATDAYPPFRLSA